MKTWQVASVAVVLVSGIAQADTHYLAPVGASNPQSPYTSWGSAANDLGAVLGVAEAGDVVLVKKGTYYPTTDVVVKGVTIRSYDPDTEKINVAETVFDGSSFGNSPTKFITISEASGNVSVIDGVTVRKFPCRAIFATDTPDYVIKNCIFSENTSTTGGAIFTRTCAGALITNCTFSANTATTGGAIYEPEQQDDVFVEISDCRFSDNEASENGGAIYGSKSVRVMRCVFDGNQAETSGGAIYSGASSVVGQCLFSGECGASYGQALMSDGQLVVTNCTFAGIDCKTGDYGLVCSKGGTIVGCAFTNNVQVGDSFVMANVLTSDLYVRNCLFADNDTFKAVFRHYNAQGFSIFADNCTIVASGKTILRAMDTAGTFHFRNSILLGTINTSAMTQADFSSCATTADDDFISPVFGNYLLKSTSAKVDAGVALQWHAGATDIRGRARVIGTVDIGCYERQLDDTDYVRTVRAVSSSGEKSAVWTDAYVGIQAAVDAAPDGALVLVKAGAYDIGETIVISNRTLDVLSCGVAGTPDRDATILDAKGATRIMIIHSGPYDDKEVPCEQHPVRLEGFTFKNGATATDDGLFNAGKGGGLLLYGRAQAEGKMPSRIVNCRFVDCRALYGAGAAALGGVFEGCCFEDNEATGNGGQGGGLAYIECKNTGLQRQVCHDRACTWYAPGLIGCTFSNNAAHINGGAFASVLNNINGFPSPNGVYGTVYVESCNFFDNRITSNSDLTQASAISQCYGSLITNCFFCGNSGSKYGICYASDYVSYVNCTFLTNSASYGCICGYNDTELSVMADRCRFSGNRTPCFFRSIHARNSLMVDPLAGDGMYVTYATHEGLFENCTFAAAAKPAVSYFKHDTWTPSVRMVNCLLWRGDGGVTVANVTGKTTLVASNSCFSAAITADDLSAVSLTDCKISANPKFMAPANGDYAIRRTSCCRDAGLKEPWMDDSSTDLAGDPRVVRDGRPLSDDPLALPDIGCYECQLEAVGMMLIFR